MPIRLAGITFRRRRDIYEGETGLYQPWYFEQRLEEECSRARRQPHPILVIIFDATPETATDTALALRQRIRDYDLVGRDGVRFFVAALEAAPQTLASLTERLASIAARPIGYAWWPESGETAAQLVASAEPLQRRMSKAA